MFGRQERKPVYLVVIGKVDLKGVWGWAVCVDPKREHLNPPGMGFRVPWVLLEKEASALAERGELRGWGDF